MKPFDYISARSVDEASAVLAQYGRDACVLAGGTDLLIEFRRENAKNARVVIDIARIPELQGNGSSNGTMSLKPLMTHSCLARSREIRESAALLASAASMIGSPQIRNKGTVGGNIMNAAACADTVPPLIALGATVTLQSKGDSHQMQLADLFVKPYETKAKIDELLTDIQFNLLPANARSAFIKLGRRNALAISRLSVAAVLVQDASGKITDARIVPGAAFPTWRRVTEAEQMLMGEKPSKQLFVAAGAKVSEVMIAAIGRRWSTEYKEPVLGVLVRRALESCCERLA